MLVFGHDISFKNFVDLGQKTDIKAGIAVGAQKRHHQWFDGGVAGAVSIRGHAGVDDIHPRLNGLQVAHG